MPGQMRVLNGKIDGGHYEELYIEKLVNDPDSMRRCLDCFVHDFVLGTIDNVIVKYEFFCEGAEYGCFEDECFILRDSGPRDS